jgi:hypothetical protein
MGVGIRLPQIAKAGNVSSQNGKRAASSVEGDQVEKRAKTGISPEVEALMTEASAKLSKGRKKRSIPEGTVSQDELAVFNLGSTIPLHKTTTVCSRATFDVPRSHPAHI